MSKKNNQVNNSNQVNNGLVDALGLNPLENPLTSRLPLIYNANQTLLSLNWIPLANTYKSNGFAQIAVDMPVEDAFRNGGYEIDSNTLSADELSQLKEMMSDHEDNERIKECLRWGQLFGGGVIAVNTNQDPDTPFNPETIYKKEVEFLALDRWQCYPQERNLFLAKKFMLQDNTLGEIGNNILFDKSRIMTFTGQAQPYYIRNQLQGWGASIFESIIPQLNQYLKANGVILELLDEAKIDILKIFNLSSTLLSKNGDQVIRKRVETFANNKNYKSMGVMDIQDDYEQKQLSFGGLDNIIEKVFLMICSTLRIPYSKVFGRGASGFSSGVDDLENYNAMVDSHIRVPATKLVKKIIDIRCFQLFGRKVPDLIINWKPLRVMSEKEMQEIENGKISNYLQLFNSGIMTRKQVAEKLNNDKIILFNQEELNSLEDEFNVEYEKG